MKKKPKYRVIFTEINMGTNVRASSKPKAKQAAMCKLKLDSLRFFEAEIIQLPE